MRKIFLISLMGLIQTANALDTGLRGFIDGRAGVRTQNDPYQDDRNLTELRLQLDSKTYFDWGEFNARGDFVYDDLANDRGNVDLETGDGFFDLRELNVLFTPADWTDMKLGRQILTWGTGDLLFINDLFPKDWNSFLLGRDEEYLKARQTRSTPACFPASATSTSRTCRAWMPTAMWLAAASPIGILYRPPEASPGKMRSSTPTAATIGSATMKSRRATTATSFRPACSTMPSG